MSISEAGEQNKRAWEYRAYEFWNRRYGEPEDFAVRLIENPLEQLKKHKSYFDNIAGKKIANLCGSNGRKAVPLALLGAEVTVFDISEENKQYALELANHSKTSIEYIVTDLYDIDQIKYGGHFDMLYLEGGILHYFHDLNRLMSLLYSMLKTNGLLVLSDFHPFRKCITKKTDGQYQVEDNYFDEEIHSGDVAFKHFFGEQEQENFPEVRVRYYTISEIINASIAAGFKLKKFEEHRGWNGENIPWEYTIAASK
ncbi:class I SAM-dependent methyltransferase [Bacillus sp. ISL-41]|uniref:class I SAM-dependent methyltransferase n=1 Tax=Bacillus sp. ISL-41 TaxID=2819127 RepID=UPI002034CCB5|nr:class I SAM-dependent methyltransferase [Bacillus sp. ISL-41]